MIKKRLLNIFIVLGIFGLFLATPPKPAYAVSDFCKPDEDLFIGINLAHPGLDIRKTTRNMIVAATTDGPMETITGRTTTQTMDCSGYILSKVPAFEGLTNSYRSNCGDVKDDASCSDMTQTYDGTLVTLMDGRGLGQHRTSGTLLGMANIMEGAGINEPVPVNMAYYWNDLIKEVPFAGTALAADVQYGNAPFIGFVLDLWKMTRNISYGILSVIMLVIGVSIMLRKKLSPQLVVTAQYALPRVVLAVILITFSYPIGAVLASSMKYLLALTNGLIYDAAASAVQGTVAGTPQGVFGGLGITGAVVIILLLILGTGGIASPILILTVLLLFAAVVLYCFVWIKAFMLYIKLIFSVIFAPLAFALGAIPGNEQSTEKWLKSAVSCVLGYVLSIGYAHMVLVILFVAVARGFSSSAMASGTAGSVILVIFFPVFVVYGFIQATKVPGKINTMIMGEEKRPGGKK